MFQWDKKGKPLYIYIIACIRLLFHVAFINFVVSNYAIFEPFARDVIFIQPSTDNKQCTF